MATQLVAGTVVCSAECWAVPMVGRSVVPMVVRTDGPKADLLAVKTVVVSVDARVVRWVETMAVKMVDCSVVSMVVWKVA